MQGESWTDIGREALVVEELRHFDGNVKGDGLNLVEIGVHPPHRQVLCGHIGRAFLNGEK